MRNKSRLNWSLEVINFFILVRQNAKNSKRRIKHNLMENNFLKIKRQFFNK